MSLSRDIPPEIPEDILDAIVDEIFFGDTWDTVIHYDEGDRVIDLTPPERTQEEIDELGKLVDEAYAAKHPDIAPAEQEIRKRLRSLRPTRTSSGRWRVNERAFGALSTSEQIAVALVLDRYDLVQRAWGTMLEAVDRVGEDWTIAARRVQRNGWDRPQT